jgi:NADH:ubiquinone oxidoreductase subunit F (NADH-binding)/NADH:ubiquinone oxidoreductase subunit E
MTSRKIPHRPIDPEILALAEQHGSAPETVLEIFTQLQEKQGSLTPQAITDVARALHVPPERAYGIATFYSMLSVSQQAQPEPRMTTVRVCDGPVCWLHRSTELHKAVESALGGQADIKVERTSCLGLCDRAPAVLVGEDQAGPITPQQAADLLLGFRGQPTDYRQTRPGELRVMMAKAGLIDPDSLDSALEHGAYCGLKDALAHKPEEVLAEVESSGLTGRGGAGFPVGRKWRFVAMAPRTPKYIICNADESEPLIFKDRVLIDTNPHQILEGMAIAGYATGAREGFVYIRGEYAGQARRLENAIHQAEAQGWLGENIQGSEFSFKVHVHRGAGAYICGEETALIESLEGKRGEPRNRPPYPPTAGYRDLPTLVNNVESYAAVPSIICQGGAWYRSLSTFQTPGTKMYMLLGHIRKPGLFEAPFGLTLRQVIDDFGGGMRPGSDFQFALTGGAAGTIVGSGLLDIPIDYASAAKGVSLGAGSFLICDQTVSPVAFLREILHFFNSESCGKCTPCRIGTKRCHQLLVRMADNLGRPTDLDELSNLANVMQTASFCGLGQSVIIPVRSAINQFGPLFQAAIPAAS